MSKPKTVEVPVSELHVLIRAACEACAHRRNGTDHLDAETARDYSEAASSAQRRLLDENNMLIFDND